MVPVIAQQRAYFASGATRSLQARQKALARLQETILAHEAALIEAAKSDLGRPDLETFTTEIAAVIHEIRHARRHLRKWMKPKSVATPLHLQPARSRIYREPCGVVLIISPWNFPFLLSFAPLIGALAAGCCAVIKPSEITPNCSRVIRAIIETAFETQEVGVVEGGVPETTELLRQRFDHVFFTGSTAVGRIVMQAAAEHVTPVTLELGGKSPAIVCEDADLDLAARRIAWGKFMNAGQTCVAPDYLLVHESVAETLTQKLRSCLYDFFGANAKTSASYGRIVNARNFDRLERMLAKRASIIGGERDRSSLFLAPTLLPDADWQEPAMQEEIFGPILPIMKYTTFGEALAMVSKHEKPLSAYLFSNDQQRRDEFLARVSFGGGCINDTILHLGHADLPFGGVGSSGIGAYHGERGFLTFSHEKSVVLKSRFLDFRFRYPPYTSRSLALMRRLFRL